MWIVKMVAPFNVNRVSKSKDKSENGNKLPIYTMKSSSKLKNGVKSAENGQTSSKF